MAEERVLTILTDKLRTNISVYRSELVKTIDLIQRLSAIEWNADTAKEYCEEQGMQITDAMIEQVSTSPASYENLAGFAYTDLQGKLDSLKNQVENLDKGIELGEFNQVYTNYVESFVVNTTQTLSSFHRAISSQHSFYSFLTTLFNQLNNLLALINPNLNELYEHFRYGNKNYVIFGKNGAGKTTLLKKVSREILADNSIIVPADRNLTIQDSGHVSFQLGIAFNSMLTANNSIEYLTREIVHKAKDEYDNGKVKSDVLTTKFYKIFSQLGLERSITAERESLLLTAGGASKYSMSTGSDGERSIAYLIMATLLAPENSYVFIDEPERHLNGALMRNLFDKLESERPDLCFIYLTHVTDFVASRKNVELIYLEKTNAYEVWNFKKIEDFDDVSLDVILSIEGTNENIIFCEGNSRTSIDCKILECLYPNHEIKPVGSCEQVKMNTRGINGKENIFRRKAFGLVDDDYMSTAEINALRANNVLTIGFNEWENLLICSEILKKVNSAIPSKDLTPIKAAVVAHIKGNGKNAVLSDFVTKRYAKIILADKISYGLDLTTRIDTLNARNRDMLVDAVSKLSQKITDSTDYDDLVSVVPAKMLLAMVAQELGLHTGDDYVDWVVKLLKTDICFANTVRNKLNISFE
ncbi:MAG: ATP-binding cassette domain-containing protein [Defluviitaleaceae bacterium]|nr:ATP-binding cassette domain-containing protein [Defluviitaleaceae bacterium]